MSLTNIHRIPEKALLALGLLVMLFAPALAEDIYGQRHEQQESASWYEKLTTPEGVQEQFESNATLFFGGVFVLGIGVSLTPCVLPMIPITISIISGSKQAVPGRSVVRSTAAGLVSSLVYVLGISITYALLGVLAAMLGVVVREIFQGWALQTVIGALFAMLGLSMIGLFALPIPGWGRGKVDALAQRQKVKRSLLAVLVLGLVSGAIASPCATPVIGALLLWVSTAGVWLGWWTLFVFGWGMGLLLIIVGVTGWAISSGKWMVTVKAVLGAVLVLMGTLIIVQGIRGRSVIPGWMISEEESAMDQTQAASLEPEPSPVEAPETVEKEPVVPQPELPKPEAKPTKIEWVYSEAEGLDLAKEAGKPTIIDFYADWCPPCGQMDRVTFADKRVIKELSRFVAIKIDLTQRTSEAETAARKYGITHIPTYIFIDTQGQKTVVSGYTPPSRFLGLLRRVK